MEVVLATETVVGIVGPEAAVEEVTAVLARHLSGVVVTGVEAVIWA